MGFQNIVRKARGSRALRSTGLVIVAIVLFAAGVQVGNGNLRLGRVTVANGNLPSQLDYSQLNTLYNSLRQNYSGGTLTETQIMDGLKHGLADAPGDPYTEYFTAKEAKQFNADLQGQTLTGIGAQLDEDTNGNIVVMSPLDGSPASRAGLRAKDVIATVDGQSTAGWSVNEAVSHIRGKKGSKVTLVVIRGGTQQLTFTITRDTINVPTATGKILDGNIGLLQVSQFSDNTVDLMRQQISKFQQAGVKKIILDLRNNPGGEVTSAQDIASLWLQPNALIMQQKGSDSAEYRATGNNPLKGMPTVVLINGGSASAAEITALALHDYKAATLMGEKSYGKGVVQSLVQFGDGSELKVTVAKWYSPHGTNINHKGITPDKTVKLPTDATSDVQLQAAEDYLSTK